MNKVIKLWMFVFVGMFLISLGSALDVYNSSNTSISTCGNITQNGTYTLINNISNDTSDCLIISADNVTIEGNGFNITGNVNGSRLSMGESSFTGLMINNVVIDGNVSLIGWARGGTVTITNSTAGIINVSGTVMSSGSVFVIDSIVETIFVSASSNGLAGSATITNSTTGIIYAEGSSTSSGGTVTITNSTTDAISSTAYYSGGSVIITNSVTMTISVFSTSGDGGTVTITNSTTGNIDSSAKGGVAEMAAQ